MREIIHLPQVFSLALDSAVIDADHILLPSELAILLPDQIELDLGDSVGLKVARQEEILCGKDLANKLLRLGSFVQLEVNGTVMRVRNAVAVGSEINGIVWDGTQAADPSWLLERVSRGEFSSPDSFFLAREAMESSTKPGFDQLLSFRAAQGVNLYPHQVSTVKIVLRQMKGRALLCDEVGLGKTVEAGLVMMEYLLRGMVNRVLILTPPSLLHQWQEEMAQKFNLDFVLSDSPEFEAAGPQAWTRFPRIIASIHMAKRVEHLKQVSSTRFDLVIVDEAHHLRRRNTLAWKLVNELDKKYILLLTATPVQNNLDELFNLITLLKPGQLKTAAEFRKRFVARGDPLKPHNVEQLKLQVSQVMIRNRRSSTGIHFTQRHAYTVRTQPSTVEESLHRLVTNMVREFYPRNELPLSHFTLKTIQMELGSSPRAAASTIERLLQDNPPPQQSGWLKEVLQLARDTSRSAKMAALQKTLAPLEGEKVVIFSHYLPTLRWLEENLKDLPLVIYHGGLSALEKDEAVERFRTEARLLLSTDSGGEGRNLQFCHILINFDLPWNPMRIEQRIGRLSRIGQQQDVYIFNLCNHGTVEDQILEVLDRKINLFELVVGELDLLLGRLGEEKDMEEAIMEMVGTSRTDEELFGRIGILGERLRDARLEYEQVKALDEALFQEVSHPGQP